MIYAEGKIVQENFKNPNLKVRFAPAPTGLMHIGNIRTALINFLMAKQKKRYFCFKNRGHRPFT